MAPASDRAVIASLTDRFYRRVYAFARQLTDPVTAEDVTQEVFLKLMRMDDLAQREIKSSYLIKMAHNLIRGQRRREVSPTGAEAGDARPVAGGDAAGVDVGVKLDQLTSQEEAAIRLTVCQGLSLREASEALGVKVTTVTNWKYRGLKKLAELGPVQAA